MIGIEEICYLSSSRSSSECNDTDEDYVNEEVDREMAEYLEVKSIPDPEHDVDSSIQFLVNDMIQFVEFHPDMTKESNH